jgi:hypothetical protein
MWIIEISSSRSPGTRGDPVLDVGDAFEVDGAGPPDHADDLVAPFEQELGEVGAVLAGDPGDERATSHVRCLPRSAPNCC